MAARRSPDPWSPRYGGTSVSFALSDTQPPLSPATNNSYSSESHRNSSDSEVSNSNPMRRIVVSPTPRPQDDDSYTDSNSIDEIQDTLSNLDHDIDDTENTLSQWSGAGRSGTGSYQPSYTLNSPSGYSGSPSFVNLPHYPSNSSNGSQSPTTAFSGISSPGAVGLFADARVRLSRITEVTEDSTRPSSGAFSRTRNASPTEFLRRSALLSGSNNAPPVRHSRSSTDPHADSTLPPPGRTNQLRAIFESQGTSQTSSSGHSRSSSTPGYRAPSPRTGSRPSSPSKSSSSTTSYGSYIGSQSETRPSLFTSSFSRPSPSTATRTFTQTDTFTQTGSRTPSSYTYGSPVTTQQSATPYSTFTDTLSPGYTNTRINDSRTNTNDYTYTETGATTLTTVTPTPTSWTSQQDSSSSSLTPTATRPTNTSLRRPQRSPTSSVSSIKDVVQKWKGRSPGGAGKASEKSPTKAQQPQREETTPMRGGEEGLFEIRRRVSGVRQRLRERDSFGNSDGNSNGSGSAGQRDSRSSIRSGALPPGFDLGQFSAYTQSDEPPVHIGLLWYLNVHTTPPYQWQRCQALLYPHMLLLSWLSAGGGRGIVALDLLNCTSVASVPSPTHPSAREDVGTIAARLQVEGARREGGEDVALMDTLVPFHMIYADGVERLGTESLGERSKWVNRLWEVVNRQEVASEQMTRSPTGSIRTILSMSSEVSRSSAASSATGSRSTVFVPPLASLPDIESYASSSPSRTTSDLSRNNSLMSSHFTRTVDDTVIRTDGDGYSYPSDDTRVITPTRRPRRGRRSGSVGELELDENWKRISRESGRSEDDVFYSGSSEGTYDNRHSGISSTYFSPDEGDDRTWGDSRTYSDTFTATGTRTLASTYMYSEGQSETVTGGTPSNTNTYLSETASPMTYPSVSPSALSRTREIRRRNGRGYSQSGSGSDLSRSDLSRSDLSRSDLSSEKQNSLSVLSEDYTRTGSGTGSGSASGTYTPIGSESYLSPADSASRSGSYTPTGSYISRSSFTGSIPSLAGSGSYDSRTNGSHSGASYTSGEGRPGTYSGSSTSQTRTYSDTGSYTRTYTPTGSYTPGSGSYTLSNGGPSGSSGNSGSSHSPSFSGTDLSTHIRNTAISSSETGYDICLSSDFSRAGRPPTYTTETEEETITPGIPSPVPSPIHYPLPTESMSIVSDIRSEREYVSASGIDSDVASIRSFESFGSLSSIPSIRSEESYKSVSEGRPPTRKADTDYETATGWSSSAASTPKLSSIGFRGDDGESLLGIPSPVIDIQAPLPETPSMLSDLESDLRPSEVPLPPSVQSSVKSLSASSPSVKSLSVKSPSISSSKSPSISSIKSPSIPSIKSPSIPSIKSPSIPSIKSPSVHSVKSLSARSVSEPPSPVPTTHSPSIDTPSPLEPLTEEEIAEFQTEPSLPSPPLVQGIAHISPLPSAPSTAPSLAPTPLPESPEIEYVQAPESRISLVSTVPPTLHPTETSILSVETPSSLSISVPADGPSSGTPTPRAVTPSAPTLPTAPSVRSAPSERGAPSVRSAPSVRTAPTVLSAPPSAVESSFPATSLHAPSISESTLSSPLDLSTISGTSSSPPPPSPDRWAASTDGSYESSFLNPSPSALTLNLEDAPDASFETSILRPSGSPSSVNRLSTIPPSPLSLGSQAPRALPPLSPVPLLTESAESEDAATPTTLSFTTTLSASSPTSSLSSFISESASLLHDLEEQPDDGEEEETRSIRTMPTLLSTPSVRSLAMTPTPMRTPQLGTPTASVAVSVTTPHGDGSTDRSSLRTVDSESTVTERDLGRDMDELAAQLRDYDSNRGIEAQDVHNNLRALREELHDLAEFLHRTPPPPTTIIIREPAPPLPALAATPTLAPAAPLPQRIVMVDEGVGAEAPEPELEPESDVVYLKPEDYKGLGKPLSRNTSNASSFISYLSSHHSDDDLLEGASEYMEEIPEEETATWSITSSSLGESETISSPSTSPVSSRVSSRIRETLSPVPTTTSVSTVTVRQRPPTPPNLMPQLNDILRTLADLGDSQIVTNRILDELRSKEPPPDKTQELADRLARIEDLVHTLTQIQGHPRAPPQVQQFFMPQPSEEPSDGSISDTTSTSQDRLRDIDRLRQLLQGIAPTEGPTVAPSAGPHAPPLPTTFDDILAMNAGMSGPVQPPPPLVPFVYQPAERPVRSDSPLTIDSLPPRSWSEPRFPAEDYLDPRIGRREAPVRIRRPPSSVLTTSTIETRDQPPPRPVGRPPVPPTAVAPPAPIPAPTEPEFDPAAEAELRRRRAEMDLLRDRMDMPTPVAPAPAPQARPPQQRPPERFHYGPGPPPEQPLPPGWTYRDPARPPSAPPAPGRERPHESWYRPPSRDKGDGTKVPLSSTRPTKVQLPPAPPGKTATATGPQYIPMPPAPTVVQIPLFDSLMEILRENRLAQLATVDQQRELMRYMRGLNEWLERDVYDRQNELRGVVARVDELRDQLRNMQTADDRTESSSPSSDYTIHAMPQPTHFGVQPPVLPPGFHPYTQQPQPPVIPTTFPDHMTPTPQFPPVIPGQTHPVQPPMHVIVQQPPMPIVPPMTGFGPHAPPPMAPSHVTHRTESPFIPPSRPSSGEPQPIRPPQGIGMGPSVIHVSESESSSSTDDSRGREGRRRHSPPSRRDSRGRTHTDSGEPSDYRDDYRRHSRYSPSVESRSTGSPRPTRPSSPRTRPLQVVSGVPPTPIPAQPQLAQPQTPAPVNINIVPPSAPPTSEYRPSSPRYSDMQPPPQTPAPQQQQQPSVIVVQQPPQQQPIMTMPPPSPGLPILQPYPPTGIPPTIGYVPTQPSMVGTMPPPTMVPTMVPSYGQPQVIYQQTSRSSSPDSRRSHSRRRRRSSSGRSRSRSPRREPAPAQTAAPAPVIIQTPAPHPERRRSRSRSRSRSSSRTRPIYAVPPSIPPGGMQQPTVIMQPPSMVPTMGPGMAPTMGMGMPPMMVQPGIPMMGQAPIIMPRPESRSSGRGRRSRSRSPRREPAVVIQPSAPAQQLPTVYPPGMVPTQPQVIIPGQMPMQQAPFIVPRSRSHSPRSPRMQPQPQVVMAPPTGIPFTQQPTIIQAPRSRSHSRSRRHSRSPIRLAAPAQPPVIVTGPAPTAPTTFPYPPPISHVPTAVPYPPVQTHRTGSPPRVTIVQDPLARPGTQPPMGYRPGSPYYEPRRPYRPRSRSYERYDPGYRSRRPHRTSSEDSYYRDREYDRRRYPRERERERYYPSHRRGRSRSRSYTTSSRSRSYTPPRHRDSRDRHGEERRSGRSGPSSGRSRRDSPIRTARSVSSGRRTPIRIVRAGRSHSRSPTPTRRPPHSGYRSVSPPSPRRPQSRPPTSRPPTSRPPTSRPATAQPDQSRPVIVTVPSAPAHTPRPPTIVSLSEEEDGDRYSQRRPASRPSGDEWDPTRISTYDPRTPSRRPSTRHSPDRRPTTRPTTYHSPERRVSTYHSPERRSPERHSPEDIHIPIPRTETEESYSPPRSPPSEPALPIPPVRVHTPAPQPRTETETESESVHQIPIRTQTTGSEPDRVSSAPRTEYSVPHVVHHPVPSVPAGPSRPASVRPSTPPVDRRGATTPFHIGTADDQRQQLEQLNEVALRLHDAAVAAQQAEDRRELEFRHHEEDRDAIFLRHEEMRNQEARSKADDVWKAIDERLATLPVAQPPAPAPPAEEPVPEKPESVSEESEEAAVPSSPTTPSSKPVTIADVTDKESDRVSIATFRQATEQHVAEVLETVRFEREEFARERAELDAKREEAFQKAEEERNKILTDRDDRIRALEEELQKVKDELANEREARLTEEAVAREQDRAERLERDTAFERQLGDITNLVQEQRDDCERKKEEDERNREEKERRRNAKEYSMFELRDMVTKLHDDLASDRQRAEADRSQCATKEDLQNVIAELQRQNDEQRRVLEIFSESWRADCARHQEETINAVKATAQEQVPYNVEGYLNEFSKALATEVRMLLGEVGKLREDRRALQHEIATLLFMKSKWGPGGEFEPDWKPTGVPPPDQGPPPPPPAEDAPPEGPPPTARPGWRPAAKKGKKKRTQQAAPPPPSQSGMEQFRETTTYMSGPGETLPRRPIMTSPRHQVQSWHAWHPDPSQRPSTPGSDVQPTIHVQAPLHVPSRPVGLFGASSSSEGSTYARLG